MLLLISHRYPVLGSVLSALSSVVFIAIGIHTHNISFVAFSALSIALSAVQFTHRRRHPAVNTQK